MEMLLKDVRYAIRTLVKAPGFTVVIIISIALGIAANATVFSVANGLLWGVLPVKDPGRMVMFSEGESFSYPDYMDYRDQTADVFEGGVAAHFPLIPASFAGTGEPERAWGQVVSGNYFSILGVNMALGRPILPEEDQVVGRDHVVVLSHSLWQRRFGADAGILGRGVVMNGQHYTGRGSAGRVLWYGPRYRLRLLGTACHGGRDHARPGSGRRRQDQAGQSMADAQCAAQAGNQPCQGGGSGQRRQEAHGRHLSQG
jgi:putative ABC transport system permease protein